jgi:non-heme chloroperoxidase
MTSVVKPVELPNRVTLHYVEQGDPSGTPLILLHAIADSWRSFELVLPHLPVSIHAFALTQRGHGDASRPESGYRPGDFAEDLVAFLDVIGVEAAVIVGGSSGGFAARRFAIDHPERTLGLVFLGSPLTLDKPNVREMFDSTIAPMTDPIDPGFVREFALNTVAKPVPPEFLDSIVAENLKAPARVWKAVSEGLLEDTSAGELNRIIAPTLILWGIGTASFLQAARGPWRRRSRTPISWSTRAPGTLSTGRSPPASPPISWPSSTTSSTRDHVSGMISASPGMSTLIAT